MNQKEQTKEYRPYCLVCSTMRRMALREYGYQCVECENKINFKMEHYE